MLASRALRPLASLATRRPLSQLVVSVVGPDRGGLVSSVTRAIAQHDGNVVESSSFSIGPVFSMAMLVEAGADQHAALTSAVQSAVPGHSVSAHEAEECVEAPAFAAALDVSCADGVGLIARVTEFVANEGLSLSKLETKTEGAPHGGTQLFSLSGVMLSKDRSRPVSESDVAAMASWVARRSARLTGRFHRRQRGQARARLQGPRARDGREHRHVRLRRRRGREDGRLAAC